MPSNLSPQFKDMIFHIFTSSVSVKTVQNFSKEAIEAHLIDVQMVKVFNNMYIQLQEAEIGYL